MNIALLTIGGLNLLVVLFLAWILSGREQEAEVTHAVGFQFTPQEEDPEDGC
jgi:hypothetical protein